VSQSLPYLGQSEPDPADVALVAAAATLFANAAQAAEAKPSNAWSAGTGALRPRP
jgi:hypothetical protein